MAQGQSHRAALRCRSHRDAHGQDVRHQRSVRSAIRVASAGTERNHAPQSGRTPRLGAGRDPLQPGGTRCTTAVVAVAGERKSSRTFLGRSTDRSSGTDEGEHCLSHRSRRPRHRTPQSAPCGAQGGGHCAEPRHAARRRSRGSHRAGLGPITGLLWASTRRTSARRRVTVAEGRLLRLRRGRPRQCGSNIR